METFETRIGKDPMMNRNPLTRRLALVLAVAVMVAIAALAAGCGQSSRTATTAGQPHAATAATGQYAPPPPRSPRPKWPTSI